MNINYVVIHKLNKERSKEIQRSTIKQGLLDPDNQLVIEFVNALNNVYGKKNNSAQFGVFEDGEGRGHFPGYFETYESEHENSDDSFHELSENTMTELFLAARDVPLATGGYIVFADYEIEEKRYLLIGMIKQKDGKTFDDDLNIETLTYIDESKLYQAARINFDKYIEYINLAQEERNELDYLSFVSPKGSSANYFIQAIGCTAGIPSAKATTVVISETVNFFNENEVLRANSRQVKEDLLAYLSEVSNSDVPRTATLSDITEIARKRFVENEENTADDLAESLYARLNSDEVGISHEFSVSKLALSKMTRIIERNNDFKLDFDKDDLGVDENSLFKYNADEDTLTITQLPDQLKDRILAQLNEYED